MGKFAVWWSNRESQSSENNRLGDTHDRPSASGRTRWTICGICIFLVTITLVVFGQTLRHKFVNYDDGRYVYGTPMVTSGLTFKGIAWAFSFNSSDNWNPLTFISHMLDCQFYGLNAGGHHLTNVLLHTVAVIMLFLVLKEMTGALWQSAFVAAVFAIHPLRVESVAWVTERKDVLSGVFFMLTLYAYVLYARRPFSLVRYLLVALSLALGLMSKPMLVTLPFVLLLLDYWPLNRFATSADSQKLFFVPRQLLFEKIPLMALSTVASVMTVLVQKNAIAPVTAISLPLRINNALVSYVTYLWPMLYPTGLAVFYPFPRHGLPLGEVALSCIVLVAISAGVFFGRRKRPYLLVGWLWYLGMLLPVIGLVQVGMQARADRYTYLPQIGLYLALTWAAARLCAGWRYRRPVFGIVAAIVITALSVDSLLQTSYWHDSESLWNRALACTTNNMVAHNNLGLTILRKGQVDGAMAHFQKALEIKPDYVIAHNNLGWVLLQKGQVDQAMVHFQKAVDLKPHYAEAHNNLGLALLQKGQVDGAMAHFQKAVEIQPNYAEALDNLGCALQQKGQLDEAMAYLQKAVEIQPHYAKAHYSLAMVFLEKGQLDEATTHFQEALKIQPDYAPPHNGMAFVFLQNGQVDQAIAHFQKALEIQPVYAEAHNNLGLALLQKGRVDQAIAHFQKALEIQPDYVKAHYNLATVFLGEGRVDQAIAHYRKALETQPDLAAVHNNLGLALLQKGQVDEAMAHFQKALEIQPIYAEAHNNLGYVLLQKGRADEAIAHYQTVVETQPQNIGVLNNLAWILATAPRASLRNGGKALELAQAADGLSGSKDPEIMGTLAAAYAEAGRYSEALATAGQALQLALARTNTALVDSLRQQMGLYQAGSPFRDTGLTNAHSQP